MTQILSANCNFGIVNFDKFNNSATTYFFLFFSNAKPLNSAPVISCHTSLFQRIRKDPSILVWPTCPSSTQFTVAWETHKEIHQFCGQRKCRQTHHLQTFNYQKLLQEQFPALWWCISTRSWWGKAGEKKDPNPISSAFLSCFLLLPSIQPGLLGSVAPDGKMVFPIRFLHKYVTSWLLNRLSLHCSFCRNEPVHLIDHKGSLSAWTINQSRLSKITVFSAFKASEVLCL